MKTTWMDARTPPKEGRGPEEVVPTSREDKKTGNTQKWEEPLAKPTVGRALPWVARSSSDSCTSVGHETAEVRNCRTDAENDTLESLDDE